MAMKTASPWWASLAFGLGLLFLFLGERLIGSESSGLRMIFTCGGVGLMIAVTAARVWTTLATKGARRRVERTFLACHVVALVALFIYAMTTSWGPTFDDKSHVPGILAVLYMLGFLASSVPVLMIELSLGVARRENFDVHDDADGDADGVEYFRVRELGWSGLSVGLALALLMVTCKVATDRNISKDVSYFKTSSPGDSTIHIVDASSEPIKAMLFFPDTNEVKDQVKAYFDSLHGASSKLEVEEHDRFADADLAALHKVTKDGVVVLTRGTGDKMKTELIDVDTDLEKARKTTGKLRNLDREVNKVLLKIVREKRKVYLLSGHGELNNPESLTPEQKVTVGERHTTVFKKRLGDLNYEVKDLGLVDLSRDVPDDATIVLMMAPASPLLDAEWDSLSRYLDRGGRLMVVMDPKTNPNLGPLEGKLGIKFNPAHLTDDVKFYPMRGTISDRRNVLTTQFSAHASTTGLSRTIDKGLLLIDSGSLEDAPFVVKGEQPKKTITIRSLESSYLDFNDNTSYDPTGVVPEKKQRYNIAAAIEGPKLPQDKDGFRALVFADADLFADVYVRDPRGVQAVMISGPLMEDAVKWLGGEENFTGDVVSEDDKPISHTKGQDAAFFSLTVVGVPLLVFVVGFTGTWARRRRSRKSEVKS